MSRPLPFLVFAAALAGCGDSASSDPAPPAAAQPAAASEPAAAPTAALPADGKRYDPAIPPAEVPSGAWMCDMGTVHFAAPHAGDCPVCGMALVKKD